jgi:hypothetical protein
MKTLQAGKRLSGCCGDLRIVNSGVLITCKKMQSQIHIPSVVTPLNHDSVK